MLSVIRGIKFLPPSDRSAYFPKLHFPGTYTNHHVPLQPRNTPEALEQNERRYWI